MGKSGADVFERARDALDARGGGLVRGFPDAAVRKLQAAEFVRRVFDFQPG